MFKLCFNLFVIIFLSGFSHIFSSHVFEGSIPLRAPQCLIMAYAGMPVSSNQLSTKPIEALTYCPHNKYLALVNSQHEVIICNAQTLEHVITIQAKKNSTPVTSLDRVSKKLAYKAQGNFLVYGSFSDNLDHKFTILIDLRKLSSGKYAVQEYPRRNVEFSNALKLFAYRRENTLSVNNNIASIQLYNRPFAYTPDSKYLCIGDLGQIEMRDAQTGDMVETIDYKLQPAGHFSFSANGGLCATNSADTITVWDLTHKKSEEVFKLMPDQVFYDIEHLSMSLDGKTISFLHNTEIYIYDLASKKIITCFALDNKNAKTIAISPDNKYVATVSPEKIVTVSHICNNQNSQNIESTEVSAIEAI